MNRKRKPSLEKKAHGFIAQSCPYLKTRVKHIFETYTFEGTQISILKIRKITMNSVEYDHLKANFGKLSESKYLVTGTNGKRAMRIVVFYILEIGYRIEVIWRG